MTAQSHDRRKSFSKANGSKQKHADCIAKNMYTLCRCLLAPNPEIGSLIQR